MENKYKNLHVGQIFKSYRELCTYLDEKIKGGDSKKAQIKEWECNFKYHKDGNKFVIDEVFEVATKKQDNRGGSYNNVYGELIQLLIVDFLHSSKGHVQITKNKLFEQLGMVNSNYNECKNIIAKVSKYIGTNSETVIDFYKTNNANFKNTIENALDNLADRRVIMYNKIVMVKELSTKIHRQATLDEMQTITMIENKVMKKLGYNLLSELRKSSDWNEFKRLTTQTLHNISDVNYYYSAYEIAINHDEIGKTKDDLLTNIMSIYDRANSKSKLNDIVLDKIDINAKKRHEDALNKTDTYSSSIDNRCSETYVDDIKKISNVLINRNHPNLNKIKSVIPNVESTIENVFSN